MFLFKTSPSCNANQHGSVVNSLFFQPPHKKMVLCQGPPTSVLISSHCSDRSQRGKTGISRHLYPRRRLLVTTGRKRAVTITHESNSAWRFVLPPCLCLARCTHRQAAWLLLEYSRAGLASTWWDLVQKNKTKNTKNTGKPLESKSLQMKPKCHDAASDEVLAPLMQHWEI